MADISDIDPSAIWLAAGLKRIRQLMVRANGKPTPTITPAVGISVIGNDWTLHVAHKDQLNGKVVSSNNTNIYLSLKSSRR